MTWFQPRKGKFNVTDKGDLLDQTFFDWRIVQPHLIAMALLAGALSVGWIKLLFFPRCSTSRSTRWCSTPHGPVSR
jgi:cellulose synthase (UDP-forming)